MITCPSCGKENQALYRFCLACGADLPSAARAPSAIEAAFTASRQGLDPSVPPTPSMRHTMNSSGSTMPAIDAAGGDKNCGQCDTPNPPDNRFCASCGFRMGAEAEEDKPQPHTTKMPPPPLSAQRARPVHLTSLNPDGSESGSFTLPPAASTIGRSTGGLFARDNYLSPRHAAFTPNGERLRVSDEDSLNGIFRKLNPDQAFLIEPGQVFRIGQELIRFEALATKPPDEHGVEYLGAPADGYVGRIVMVLGRTTSGTAFPVPETGLHLGRERGEVIFADDGYVSGLHCRLSYERGRVYLTDLGSSNGTFVRIRGEADVGQGEILLMGQQLFRVNLGAPLSAAR